MNFSVINAFLQIISLILCTFFMLSQISCIKIDKMLFSLLSFVKNSVGRVGALPTKKLSKNNLSKLGQEGGWSTLVWIMSLNILLFFFDVTPNSINKIKFQNNFSKVAHFDKTLKFHCFYGYFIKTITVERNKNL